MIAVDFSSCLFGIFLTLFAYILLFRAKKSDLYVESSTRIYLNIFLRNRKDVLENIVRRKVSKNRRFMRAIAKRLAVNLVTDSKMIEKVGNDLKASIPSRLELAGLRSTANIVYQQSAFICIEINLLSVDLIKSIENNGGKSKAQKLKSFFDAIPIPGALPFIEYLLALKAKGKIIKQLPITIKQKLQDKLVADVDIYALEDDEQGPFLIQTIQQLKASTSKDKNDVNNNSNAMDDTNS